MIKVISFSLVLIIFPIVVAADSCTLQSLGDGLQLIVYEESGAGTNGKQIWSGTLNNEEHHQIFNNTGRIRYDYMWPDGQWQNVGAWCHDNSTVQVP